VGQLLIEQVQTAPRQTFSPASNPNPSFDIRFSHAVKAIFFMARNTTFRNQWSNYTVASPVVSAALPPTPVVYDGPYNTDPVLNTSLIYENTNRFTNMGSDYFNHSTSIPSETGYHIYSYSLKFVELDPMGSTNYGKLANVSIVPTATQDAVTASNGAAPAGSGANFPQTYEFIVIAINNNVVRIAGGALGFPVL
jgi:Large eukaryotic DNA virus major capsid protein